MQDNRSDYYNRYRNKSQGGFRWRLPASDPNSSERLTDYPKQYEFSIVTGFNYGAQVRHRGSGIFLHVNGKGATAGCVSAPRAFIVKPDEPPRAGARPADRDRPLGSEGRGQPWQGARSGPRSRAAR